MREYFFEIQKTEDRRQKTSWNNMTVSFSMLHVVPSEGSLSIMKNPSDSGQLQIFLISQISNMNCCLSHSRVSRSEGQSSTRHVLSPQKKTNESSRTSSENIQMQHSKVSISDSQIDHGGQQEYQNSVEKNTTKISQKLFASSRVMKLKDFILPKSSNSNPNIWYLIFCFFFG